MEYFFNPCPNLKSRKNFKAYAYLNRSKWRDYFNTSLTG